MDSINPTISSHLNYISTTSTMASSSNPDDLSTSTHDLNHLHPSMQPPHPSPSHHHHHHRQLPSLNNILNHNNNNNNSNNSMPYQQQSQQKLKNDITKNNTFWDTPTLMVNNCDLSSLTGIENNINTNNEISTISPRRYSAIGFGSCQTSDAELQRFFNEECRRRLDENERSTLNYFRNQYETNAITIDEFFNAIVDLLWNQQPQNQQQKKFALLENLEHIIRPEHIDRFRQLLFDQNQKIFLSQQNNRRNSNRHILTPVVENIATDVDYYHRQHLVSGRLLGSSSFNYDLFRQRSSICGTDEDSRLLEVQTPPSGAYRSKPISRRHSHVPIASEQLTANDGGGFLLTGRRAESSSPHHHHHRIGHNNSPVHHHHHRPMTAMYPPPTMSNNSMTHHQGDRRRSVPNAIAIMPTMKTLNPRPQSTATTQSNHTPQQQSLSTTPSTTGTIPSIVNHHQHQHLFHSNQDCDVDDENGSTIFHYNIHQQQQQQQQQQLQSQPFLANSNNNNNFDSSSTTTTVNGNGIVTAVGTVSSSNTTSSSSSPRIGGSLSVCLSNIPSDGQINESDQEELLQIIDEDGQEDNGRMAKPLRDQHRLLVPNQKSHHRYQKHVQLPEMVTNDSSDQEEGQEEEGADMTDDAADDEQMFQSHLPVRRHRSLPASSFASTLSSNYSFHNGHQRSSSFRVRNNNRSSAILEPNGYWRIRIRKSKPFLGIAIEGGSNVSAQSQPRIINIQEGGAAADGLRVGHIIMEVDGQITNNMNHEQVAQMIARAYYNTPEKDYVEFVVREKHRNEFDLRRSSFMLLNSSFE